LTAVARDSAGNSTTAATINITVDNGAPTVTMLAPAQSASVGGSAVTVAAGASDNLALAGVQFKLDGVNLGLEKTFPPFSLRWDATTTSSNAHVLTAVARDSAGNITTSTPVTVIVDNTQPDVSLSAPANGQIVGGPNVLISATASDNDVVAGVQLRIDGNNLGSELTSAP
jgi:hypothetical protein